MHHHIWDIQRENKEHRGQKMPPFSLSVISFLVPKRKIMSAKHEYELIHFMNYLFGQIAI